MKTSTPRNLLCTALLAVLACALPALAGPDNVGLGTGRDGPLRVTVADTGILNTYAQVTAALTAGATDIPVSTTAGISAGDLVMVHQSTNITPVPTSGEAGPIDISGRPVGRWEFGRVETVLSPTMLRLTQASRLLSAYAATGTQLIRVPEYTTVTIDAGTTVTAPPWDGSTGGIVAFLATGAVQLDGDISVTGLGFRGGLYVQDTVGTRAGCVGLDEPGPAGGRKGEGVANMSFGASFTGRGRLANAGGGGVCSRSGGGGGGSAGSGGQGGFTDSIQDPDPLNPGHGRAVGGQGGTALTLTPAAQVSRLVFGGGGGAGHGTITGVRSGGAGGGIIFVRAQTLAGPGSILSSGNAGDNTSGNSAAHGGGAGGTVYLRFASIAECDVLALGGPGGSTSAGSRFVGPGGGGGGGYVLLQFLAGTCDGIVLPGNAGQRASNPPGGDPRYGATDGAVGIKRNIPGGFPLLSAPVVTTPGDGSSTNDTTPTYVGTLPGTFPAGTEVVIFVDGVEVGRVTPDAGGDWTFTQPVDLAVGAHTVSAVAVNTAQGVQSASSNTNTFTVDLTAPTVDVVAPANGTVTNNPLPVYSGTVEAGSTVSITVDGVVLGNATVTGTNWTFTPTAPLGTGTHTVTATATDAAGNTATDSNTFMVDVTPPTVDVVAPGNGSVINNPLPVYSGTVEAGSTVSITVDGVVLGNATVTGMNWTFTPTTPLGNGAHTVTATATDAVGNTATDSHTFTVDLTPPTVDVETPANGSVINNPLPVYSGTVEAGSTVSITVDGTVLGNATVTGTRWEFTPTAPLPAGAHTVTAIATDAAGNTATDSHTFTVDLTPPAVDVETPANGSVINNPLPVYSGTVEAGSTVTITVDGVVLGNATVTGTRWEFIPTTPLGNGAHTVTATATDAAGNTATDSHTFTVDLTPPAVNVETPVNGSVTNNPRPVYSGTVEAGSTVTITVDGVVLGNATVTGTRWTFTPTVPLADGPHTVTATATDAVGNTATDSNTFSVDTMGPAAPEVRTPPNGSITNDSTPTYGGTAEPGSTVTIYVDGVAVGTTTADAAGNWTFTPTAPLADGPHTVSATAEDALGNTSPNSNTNTFTVDTTAPAAPEVRTPANGSSTPDNTPTYSGTAEPGSTVEVFVDGASVGTTTADTNGNWNLTPVGGLAAGQHTVKATATDAAGNTSPDSNTNTFTVASIAPQAPVITGPENNTVTDDNTPAFTGTAPPGNTVTIILNGTPVGTTTADANGNWSFTPTTPLEDGPYELTVTATDPAGNVSAPSSPVRFTVETEVAPPLPEGDKDFLGDGLGCASTAGDPSALAMMGLALLAVLGARRRQR